MWWGLAAVALLVAHSVLFAVGVTVQSSSRLSGFHLGRGTCIIRHGFVDGVNGGVLYPDGTGGLYWWFPSIEEWRADDEWAPPWLYRIPGGFEFEVQSYWIAAAVPFLLMWGGVVWYRERWSRLGVCRGCGYAVGANGAATLCSECGAVLSERERGIGVERPWVVERMLGGLRWGWGAVRGVRACRCYCVASWCAVLAAFALTAISYRGVLSLAYEGPAYFQVTLWEGCADFKRRDFSMEYEYRFDENGREVFGDRARRWMQLPRISVESSGGWPRRQVWVPEEYRDLYSTALVRRVPMLWVLCGAVLCAALVQWVARARVGRIRREGGV